MTTEMDIDMDLDMEYVEDLPLHEVDSTKDQNKHNTSQQAEVKPILIAPNDISEPNYLDQVTHKVYLRGLENLTTHDIYSFADAYFDSHKPSHIEWIDDASANLVYQSSNIASKALRSFSTTEPPSDFSQIPVLQTIQAKPFPKSQKVNLEVRIAVRGDKKQAGARERSRFYLINPEYDPALQGKRASSKITKNYRNRSGGDNSSQEHEKNKEKRQKRKHNFDSSLRDDADSPVLFRGNTGRRRWRDETSGPSRRHSSRQARSSRNGKELFPDHEDQNRGRLRNQSASPPCDENEVPENSSFSVRVTAQALTSKYPQNQKRKEDFSGNGINELFSRTKSKEHLSTFDDSDPLSKCKNFSRMENNENLQPNKNLAQSVGALRKGNLTPHGINIRGITKALSSSSQSFAIKGAASSLPVKELFPSSLGKNNGKELLTGSFNEKVHLQNTVKDLFY
ncbi:hypothetical protein GcM1_222055 [Golovinomyces cichoracearum]|uniref:Nuclear cap-binding protein subunit 3 n=1 Tax=Golovinomyces cichoracearum TaxID=62708 RepID=A0A420IRG5_9PEZI|nr:hypothetical protein GcM1_222055 [Golovinomyces cichoracearum]